jgi:hypothetical protein
MGSNGKPIQIFLVSSDDPHKLNQTGKGFAPVIQGGIDEVRRWEDIPDQQEPFTLEMLRYLIALRASLPYIHGPDSALATMIDFLTMGLYDGYRLSKWAQPTNGHHQDIHNPHLNFKGKACAFCISDVQFYSTNKMCIPIDQVLKLTTADSTILGRDEGKYRTQQNGQNGEMRTHTRNDNAPDFCHVPSLHCVVSRFVRLIGVKQNTPPSIYRHDNGTVCYVTASLIKSTLRMAAPANVYSPSQTLSATALSSVSGWLTPSESELPSSYSTAWGSPRPKSSFSSDGDLKPSTFTCVLIPRDFLISKTARSTSLPLCLILSSSNPRVRANPDYRH